jgi:hypothetical protein
MISFNQFKSLPVESQVDQLSLHAISLDLSIEKKGVEVVLFSLNDFYVELHLDRFTDRILKISPFRSLKKLDSYLPQVDINEINNLFSWED